MRKQRSLCVVPKFLNLKLPIITAGISFLPHYFIGLHAEATIASISHTGAFEERFVVMNLLGAKRDSLYLNLVLHGFHQVKVELPLVDTWMLIHAVF